MQKTAGFILTSALGLSVGCFSPSDETRPFAPQRLVIGIRQGPETLDPAAGSDNIYLQIVFNIFETLVRVDSANSPVQPQLATAWKMRADSLGWIFALRDRVFFHDGTPFNAAAVKASFERQYKRDSRFCRSDTTDAYGRLAFSMIKEIRVIDDLTVEFILHYPYAAFLYSLASPLLATIVSPTALEKYGVNFGSYPIGTGPLQFKNWERGQHINLTAFSEYWGRPSNLAEVTYQIEPILKKRLDGLASGQFHIIPNNHRSQRK